MSQQRTRYSGQFTFQVALEAAKGLKTINELASEHGVHPTQVSEWKRQLLDAGDTFFNRDGARHHREQQEGTRRDLDVHREQRHEHHCEDRGQCGCRE